MGRPKIQLAAALKAASIQCQVFIKRARPTVHRIAADRRLRAEPEVEVVHDPKPLGQGGQQIPRLQRPVEHQFLAAEGVEAIQGEGLHNEPEPIPLIGPTLNAGIVPVDIAGRLRDEHRVFRIELAQPTRPIDRHVDPEHPLDVLELVPHPLFLRQSPGVPLLLVVDPEFALLHRVEFNGKGLIIEGIIRAVKLEIARPDGSGKVEVAVRPDGHAAITWFNDDSAVAGHVHPRHPFQLEQAVEQTDLPVGRGARFGAEEQHIVIPPACRIGQVSEELVGRRGLPRPEVHLEVPLVRQHDHHGPGLRLGQPDGRGELLAAEGRVSRGPNVVVDPGDGVNRIDALHVPEDIAVEKILTEQDGRRAARARRPLQPQPILIHFPGQHIAIQRDLVVGVGERPRAQPLLGPNKRKALAGQIESKVQLRVIDAVRSKAHNRLDPLPSKLLGLEDEQARPALHQDAVRPAEIQLGRFLLGALALQLGTPHRQTALEIHPGHNVRHGQPVDVGVEAWIARRIQRLPRLLVPLAGSGLVGQLPEQGVWKQLRREPRGVHRQARRLQADRKRIEIRVVPLRIPPGPAPVHPTGPSFEPLGPVVVMAASTLHLQGVALGQRTERPTGPEDETGRTVIREGHRHGALEFPLHALRAVENAVEQQVLAQNEQGLEVPCTSTSLKRTRHSRIPSRDGNPKGVARQGGLHAAHIPELLGEGAHVQLLHAVQPGFEDGEDLRVSRRGQQGGKKLLLQEPGRIAVESLDGLGQRHHPLLNGNEVNGLVLRPEGAHGNAARKEHQDGKKESHHHRRPESNAPGAPSVSCRRG